MFQTLKAKRTNTGESAYVVQSSGLPFDKDKTKKPRACAHCKLKKLKCVPEGDSCAKCLKQGLECSYRSGPPQKSKTSAPTSSSHRQSSWKSGTRVSSPQIRQEGAPESPISRSPSVTSGARTVDMTPESSPGLSAQVESAALQHATFATQGGGMFPDEFQLSDFFEGDINMDFWNIPNEGVTIGDTTMYLTTDEQIQPYTPEIDHYTSALPHLVPPTVDNTINYPRANNLPTPAPTGDWTLPSNDTPSSCCCLERLMSANEAMQVKLVWGSGSAVSVDDMLQCQKDMLASCGNLLECRNCSLRSDYVMLVVSMCREMISGIMDLGKTIVHGSQSGRHGSRKRTCSDDSNGTLSSLQRVNAGGWRLDDQDEMAVIKSLIGIRITRLRSLVSRLEEAINTHHPHYDWIISALRQIVSERITTIETEVSEM